MARRREGVLLTMDRDIAELFGGRRRGRPTISRRFGGAIARSTGVSVSAGTDIFHGLLVLGGLALLATSVR